MGVAPHAGNPLMYFFGERVVSLSYFSAIFHFVSSDMTFAVCLLIIFPHTCLEYVILLQLYLKFLNNKTNKNTLTYLLLLILYKEQYCD